MKYIIVLAAVIAFAYGEYKVSEEFSKKVEAELEKIVEKCIKEENATEADIKEMDDDKIPTTREGKCMLSCIFQTLNAQGKDGKFTKDSIMKTLEPYKSEDMVLYDDMCKLLVDKCLPEVKSADRCDAAVEMAGCYDKNATPDMDKVDGFW